MSFYCEILTFVVNKVVELLV